MSKELQVHAHAKVNLFLSVGARRPDGYHEIETILRSISVADRIHLRRTDSPGVSLTVLPALPVPAEHNIVSKAAELFLKSIGESRSGLAIELTKVIPWGAGLGGGSADAAGTLRAANRLFDNPLSDEKLSSLALQLGADVPFCLTGGLATARGIGEKLEYHPPCDLHLVLIKPELSISTAWAYGATDAEPIRPKFVGLDVLVQRLLKDGALSLASRTANEFESVVFAAHPSIRDLKSQLADAGASWSLLTGSGSAVYGVFASADQAKSAAAQLAAELPGHAVMAASGVPRGVEGC